VRALVVDDEPLVRSELLYALGRVDGDLVLVESDNAAHALALLASETFDVVFLDINLPGMSGLEAMTVINNLPHRPHVVFVTAYERHALKAFELAATDYVVKPVSEARLATTLARIRNVTIGSAGAADVAETPDSVGATGEDRIPESGRIPLEYEARTLLVRIDEIRYVHASGHIVNAKTLDHELRFRGSLGECAARLEPLGFLRVHRSYLVNPQHVVEIQPFFGGTHILRVDDRAGSDVPVSRGYMPAVRRAFGL
jgi:DNA-binding LytR/AlgR family response regulator